MSEVFQYKPSRLTIKINSDSDTSRLKIVFAAGESSYPPIVHPLSEFNQKSLERELVSVREKMSTWSKQYDSFLADRDRPLTCDPEKVKKVWKGLADWGRSIYRDLFDIQGENNAELIDWSKDLKELKGERIVVDSAIGNIPWGLLYDDVVPETLEGDYLPELLSHFWATKYQLEVLPDYPHNRVLWRPDLRNTDSTRFTVTINKDIKGKYGDAQDTFFDGLAPRLKASVRKPPSTLVVNYDKVDVIDSITQRQEPQHLIYFFCHHKKADGGWTLRGYRDFEQTKLIIRGEDPKLESATLSIKEMKNNEHIKGFSSPPVVFFNACESSQTEIGDPSSFMQYFVKTLKSYAFIGTEAEIPAAFADEFGKYFVGEFLNAERIGQILFDERREFAKTHCNPFGLYYTLYGDGNVHLQEPVKEN